MKKLILAATLVAMVTSAPAVAEVDTDSANYTLPGCRAALIGDKSNQSLQGFCIGKVTAVVSLGLRLDFCTPDKATVGEGVHIIIQFLDARPTRMNENFVYLTAEALRQAWPCQR